MWATAGIGAGALELVLPRFVWRAGEVVRGRVMLALEEPLDGRRLVIGVHVTEKRCVTDPRGQLIQETRTRYRVERQLAGRRRYHSDVFDFQLPLPEVRSGLDWRIYAALDDQLEAGAAITVE